MAKGSKLAAKSTELVGLLEKLGSEKTDGFFRKRNLNFWKQLILANLMSTATETVSQFDVECEWNIEVSQNVQELGFLRKKDGFYEKILKLLKIADGNKLAVQCEGISKISQNVQILGFGNIKEDFGFSRKTEDF